MYRAIQSRSNEEFKICLKCKERKGRDKHGLFLLEGDKSIREILDLGIYPELLYVRESSAWLDIVARDFPILENKIRILSQSLFTELSDTVMAQDLIFVGQLIRSSIDALPGGEDVVVMDRIQDPGNLGTILRTAIAAGVTSIVVTKGTVDLYNPKVLRATAGSLFRCRIYYVDDYDSLLDRLNGLGLEIVCADIAGTVNLFDMVKNGVQALVVGNEHQGPASELVEAAQQLVRIPMPGEIESLNVSVAAALLIYESYRKSGVGGL